MDTIKLTVGSYTHHGDRIEDYERPVEFVGELVHSRTEGDTRGVTETLYRIEHDVYVVHVESWSRWQGEPTHSYLVKALPADLDVGGRFEFLGRAAGMARPLTLDEALSEPDDDELL
jgi:hypothetical protein